MNIFNLFKKRKQWPNESLSSLIKEGVVRVKINHSYEGLNYFIMCPFPINHAPLNDGVMLSYPDGSSKIFISADSDLTFA